MSIEICWSPRRPLRRGLVIGALACAAGLFAGAAGAADCSKPTKLSLCKPDAAQNVTIGGSAGCNSVYIDQSLSFKDVTIADGGALCLRDSDLASVVSVRLRAERIIVHGVFEAGTKDTPIGTGNPANRLAIIFTGRLAQTKHDGMMMDPSCADATFQKGLEVCKGGELRLFGAKGAPPAGSARLAGDKVSWTHLAAPAGDPCRFGATSGVGSPVSERCVDTVIGGKTITLADKVDWQEGDWIVIATTSFSPFETEFARIARIDPSKTVLTLVAPLVYYHFGGADPGPPSQANFNAGRETNWGVDERAEVGLISRNIQLTAEMSGAPGDHGGGETIFRPGFKEASVQGVELTLLGKPKLGSYPIHFHMDGALGADQTVLVNANSIHHTFNKCVTVHSTQHLTIQNNVCARAVGHLFYQEIGDEEDITFAYNLGLGAMSNNFGVHAQKGYSLDYQLIDNYWWPGDNLGRSAGFANYFALNVENHDNQTNPTHGSCRAPLSNGGLGGGSIPCPPNQYFEPASGFWIINPGTKLIGNSIGGCQGVGRAYWYVPPVNAGSTGKPELANLKFKPIGEFRNNRAHSCYAGLYAEPEDTVVSEQLLPHAGGTREGASVFNVVDGLTVTRMRDRGIWLRPSFWVVKNARLATNRDSVSLVTAGGVDGTAPGNWALLEDSVLLGISLNNVDRFGPCPYPGVTGPASGAKLGCIDQTPYDPGAKVVSGDDIGRGYPHPQWNFFGLMIYDGPGRYFRDRFVNFNRNIVPYLTAADQAALGWFSSNNANPLGPDRTPGSFVYEGDAALGWFNANQSSYPNTQASEGLVFENVDLRHQIYTDRVGIDTFNDGDKNTLILDRDGSLTNMKVVGPDQKSPVGNVFPASLNNLTFNAASNSVDECLSTGDQNAKLEGRPTSLITPSTMATLEFSSLFPKAAQKDKSYRYEQILRFAKTASDTYPSPVGTIFGEMDLHGRNGLGVWEPKLSNGHGYTVSAHSKYNAPGLEPAPAGADVGIPASFNLGLTDAVLPLNPTKPFRTRVAVCFTDKTGAHPKPKSDVKSMFSVVRGYKAYGSPTSNESTLEKFWRDIPTCKNLDSQNSGNVAGCPAVGPVVDGACPDGQPPVGGSCPTKAMTFAPDLASFMKNEESWFYDPATGWLHLHVVQSVDNASGPSPTGSCDPALNPNGIPPECPNASKVHENYYFCPAGGCIAYGVNLVDGQTSVPYEPGVSTCAAPPADPPPDAPDLLADLKGEILTRVPTTPPPPNSAFPHYALKSPAEPVMCPNLGSSIQPPWGPTPGTPKEAQSFQVNYDPLYQVQVGVASRPGVVPIQFQATRGNLVLVGLTKGTTYRIVISRGKLARVRPKGKPAEPAWCAATFEPTGTAAKPEFKRIDGGKCIPDTGAGAINANLG